MDFEQFLTDKMQVSAAQFAAMEDAEKEAIRTAYYLTQIKELESRRIRLQREEEAKNEQQEQIADIQNHEAEKVYNEWDFHFAMHESNIDNDIYKSTKDNAADSWAKKSKERKEKDLQIARRSAKNDLKNLLFAEADALEASVRQESWERMIPVGKKFAETLQYACYNKGPNETLSDTVKKVSPLDVDSNMFSYRLKRFNDRNPDELTEKTVINELFPKGSKERGFYDKHRHDDVIVKGFDEKNEAAHSNVEFALNEMFRLNARMKRNSRCTRPMKELCAKLDTLKHDYEHNREAYQNMTIGRLNVLMDSVMLSADKYLEDKKDLTSFSDTQIERLKCVNRLKTLRDSIELAAMQNEFVYGNEVRIFNPKVSTSYLRHALAEKICLAKYASNKDARGLCDRAKLEQEVLALEDTYTFDKFLQNAFSKDNVAKNDKAGQEKTIRKLLKISGKTLYNDYQNEKSKRAEANNKGPVKGVPGKF